MTTVHFNEAFAIAAAAASSDELPLEPKVRLIRDIYGKIRFAIDADRQNYPAEASANLEKVAKELGAFGAEKPILYRDDFSDAESVFSDSSWHTTLVVDRNENEEQAAEYSVELLDRQVTGQEWLEPGKVENSPPRLVFYGMKGGVGRSTALALLSYRLAKDGKNVLLVDLDLESPGLSGLLLAPERAAEFGVVDWFIEDAVGQGNSVLENMVSDSPLSANTTGRIRVAAAMGSGEVAYLPKLARVYADVPGESAPKKFGDRMRELITLLERQEAPDVVLIDSRAGLHDIAAVAITHLATTALLFANDTAQTWQGYAQLFAHWQRTPAALRAVRTRLLMVQALFPEADQAAKAESFIQNSYELFLNYLYDQVPAATGKDAVAALQTQEALFSFDTNDEDAPHFPLRIRWNARFQEFNPLISGSRGGLDDADIELTYGSFFKEVMFALSEGADRE
jgi:MinD-like ATPase involved in chromosome partitioning or flagellar assembly